LHPKRRAPLLSGHEIDGSADAQRKSSGDPPRLQQLSKNLLLWSTDGNKTKSERAVGFSKLQTGFDFLRIANESHGRAVVVERFQSVGLDEQAGLFLTAPYQDDRVGGRDRLRKKSRRQVAARAHSNARTPGSPKNMREKSTIKQYVRCVGILFLKTAIIVIANQMIYIRRDHIAESVRTKS